MSKKITPCEKLGYKVGDKFKASKSGAWFKVGEEVELGRDDGSNYPFFFNERMPKDIDGGWPRHVESVEKISNAKLKPAKQALADAIHKNGGWLIAGDYSFVTSNHRGVVKFFHQKPRRDGVNWVGGSCSLVWVDLHQQLPNWHQCILSRDEYFTAYPEQVKVKVNNKTEHKVEVEMKSESEMTIKIGGDWHKNGELPPVGETVEVYLDDGRECWHRAYVVGYSFPKGSVIAASITEKNDKLIWSNQFRPLRSERDKAIDEIVLVANSIGWNSKESNKIISEVAGAIYDAGMYKEVK